MADIADLTQRLQDHQDQLGQIEELLRQAPDDAELLKIKSDLEQVIALTEELGGGALAGKDNVGGGSSKWKVGDRCTSKWEDGKYYSAVISEMAEDDIHIMYLDYGNKATVPESTLKAYVPLPTDQLVKGAMVRAIWADDGHFYDGIIVSDEGNDRFMIRFPRFGKKKYEVGAYDVTPRIGNKTAAVAADAPLPETLEIPDSLRLKPTDTEAQRRSKRARVKALKQGHKKRKIEQEGARKQNNWLAFQKSAKTGFGRKKRSMFATDENGTVGVIGSGKGMSKNPELIRNKYEEYDDEEGEGEATTAD